MGAMDDYLSDSGSAQSSAKSDSAMDDYLGVDSQAKDHEGLGSKALGLLDKVTDYNPLTWPTKWALKGLAQDPQTFGEHAANQATLGYLPQLQAATAPAIDKGLDLITGNHVSDDDNSTYVQRRDENIKRLAQEEKNHPQAAKAGDVTGMVTGGLAMSGLAPIEGATALQRAKGAAKVGATIGALANPGDTEGEVNPLQLGGRVVNAAGGAALGFGAQLGAEGLSSLGSKASDYLSERAGQKAAKAIGIDKPAAKVLMTKYGPDSVRELGQTALDENLIGPLQTPEKIADSAAKAKEGAGAAYGELLDSADSGGAPKISAKDIALELANDPELAKLKTTPGAEGQYEKLMNQLQTLYNNGDELSLREAQALRQRIDKQINFNKAVPELRGTQENLYNARDSLANRMNDSVNSFNGDNADQLKQTGRRYSDLSRIQDIATKRSAGNAANRAIGLTDTISGAGGAGAGAAIGGMAGGIHGAELGAVAGEGIGMGVNKLARTFGPGADAVTSDALSRVLANSPELAKLVQSNPQALPMLMQKLTRNNQQAKTPENVLPPEIIEQLKKNPQLIDQFSDPKLKEIANKAIGRDTASVTPNQKNVISPDEAKRQFLNGGE